MMNPGVNCLPPLLLYSPLLPIPSSLLVASCRRGEVVSCFIIYILFYFHCIFIVFYFLLTYACLAVRPSFHASTCTLLVGICFFLDLLFASMTFSFHFSCVKCDTVAGWCVAFWLLTKGLAATPAGPTVSCMLEVHRAHVMARAPVSHSKTDKQ